MKNSIFEDVGCNICGSHDYNIIYKEKYSRKSLGKDEIIKKFKSSGDETLSDRVVRCKRCGLMFISPRIRQDIIIRGYSGGEDKAFVSQAKGRELTFRKMLGLIEKHSKKGSIIDIGTAAGSFLHVAKENGWKVAGVEPNRWLCGWGKKNYGIDIKPGTIFDNKFKSASFDVVSLLDVIEHTPDPKRVLKECNRLLKKNGLLVINYPDIGSWIARLMGRRWVFLLSVHLYYFNRKTIRKILEQAGFEAMMFRPHYQKLGLGYLAGRMGAYSKTISKVGLAVINALHIGNIQIPYWLGQTLVLAKKRV